MGTSKGRPASPDVKLRLKLGENEAYYYPDLVVTCDPRDTSEIFIDYPSLVIEVLLPGTQGTDRREKLQAYTSLDTLQVYALVEQDRRRTPFTVRDGDVWATDRLESSDARLRVEHLCREIPFDQIYARVS